MAELTFSCFNDALEALRSELLMGYDADKDRLTDIRAAISRIRKAEQRFAVAMKICHALHVQGEESVKTVAGILAEEDGDAK